MTRETDELHHAGMIADRTAAGLYAAAHTDTQLPVRVTPAALGALPNRPRAQDA